MKIVDENKVKCIASTAFYNLWHIQSSMRVTCCNLQANAPLLCSAECRWLNIAIVLDAIWDKFVSDTKKHNIEVCIENYYVNFINVERIA